MDNVEIHKEITSFVTLLIDGESSCYCITALFQEHSGVIKLPGLH